MLRRLASQVNIARSSPEEFFRKFNITGSGSFSQTEFELMVRTQDPQIMQTEVDWLWRMADADGDGRVELYELGNLMRRAQLENEDVRQWSNGPPTEIGARDRALEARVTQFARKCNDRNLTMAQVFALYDPTSIGFLDRTTFSQLFVSQCMDLAEWELQDLVAWFRPLVSQGWAGAGVGIGILG